MRFLFALVAALAFFGVCAAQSPVQHLGFDRNIYPGDEALPALRQHFAYSGYWLNNPPGARADSPNTWRGKRETLRKQGFGFLVLFNGRLEAEIASARRRGTQPAALGKQDASAAIAAARREHFPARTILFLDQEEGGRLTPQQAAYFFAWTEAVAASEYLPGAYLSGQPVSDDPGKTITTAEDVRQQVAAKHLHPVALFVYQDACPPSNGCTMTPPPITSAGVADAIAWQYAQSPRRAQFTQSCAQTYSADKMCYAPGVAGIYLDLSVAASDDPSHGR